MASTFNQLRLLLIFILPFFYFSSNAQEEQEIIFPDSLKVMTDLYALSADSMQGRQTNTKGSEMARQYILNELQAIGVPAYVPNYTQEFEFSIKGKEEELIKGVNILAYVEGFSNEETIVVSAHYDHVGMKDSTEIFNGADDNASGTATLLALSRYFTLNQPDNSLLFAFFDAEEMGLQGAKYFMQSVVADSSMIKLNINLDMVGRGDKNEIYAVGTYFHPELKPFVEEAAKDKSIKVLFGRDQPKKKPNWVESSDHAPFHKAGIPFIYFGVDDHADYHKPTDTADKINPDFYLETILMIKDVVQNCDANLRDINVAKSVGK
ncbi:M28 family peptidase [Marivirga sp. S37H4]|uniref:M28 family peptidase n=1 Tax=Marivirga aurantiaca TaxID=2802615 RepID=A0A934X1C1_9BACT|nr:M28 family peptidase [Marivirga aurantiaca]MBK6267104.1 M28 family peptidase [Marivirga aurantiaca]